MNELPNVCQLRPWLYGLGDTQVTLNVGSESETVGGKLDLLSSLSRLRPGWQLVNFKEFPRQLNMSPTSSVLSVSAPCYNERRQQ